MRKKSVTSAMMKSYIADALLLLMEKQDFQNITIGEIVKKAGVNRSTYYRHFDKKEDVILYFLESLSAQFAQQEGVENLALKEYLIKLFEHYSRYKTQMLTIYKSGQAFLLLEVLKKQFDGETYADQPTGVQYNIAFHVGGTFNHFLLWFSRNMEDPPEAIAGYTLDVLPKYYVNHVWTAKNSLNKK